MNKNILVVGGAGYIGSHTADLLQTAGYRVAVLDNLSTGHRQAVGKSVALSVGDMANGALVEDICRKQNIGAIMHFAARIVVSESVANPAAYYQNNVCQTLQLLDSARAAGVRDIVFSSSAAVFGRPQYLPIDEAHPKNPVNPYGQGKLMVENILADYARAYEMRCAVLRYFNAAGAHPEGRLGEWHDPETHLIPLALQAAKGEREHFEIYGEDYDTPDGTCIRDYIHICDIARAHILALEKMRGENRSVDYNLGNGGGFSVQQVLDVVREVTGRNFEARVAPRRPGDPDALVANADAAKRELGWSPQFGDLKTIVSHAWRWEQERKFNPQ